MKTAALVFCSFTMIWAQGGQPAPAPAPTPPFRQYLKVQQYSADEDARIIKLYDGLRVCDVIDGLDAVGLQEVTMMDMHIRPLWRDEQKITHRIHGVALTIRLVPAQATSPKFATHAEERTWEAGGWGPPSDMRTGGGRGGYPGLIRPGTVLVVDNQAHDDGFCGSNMGTRLFGMGLRGFVGNAVCRDTDEMAMTKIPVYQDPMQSPRGINQGRMWVESYNQPIVVGGVLVMPGDVIVADNDGVAVVPRAQAEQVAGIARWIFEDDEIKRGKIYDEFHRPRDWTVDGHTPPPPATTTPIRQTPSGSLR